MGRQRQSGGARRKHTAADEASLREALDATQRHTLPVLPAGSPPSPAPQPRAASHSDAAPPSARQSASPRSPRRTLGEATVARTRIVPGPRVPHESSADGYALPDLNTSAVPPLAPVPAPWEAPLAASPVADLLTQTRVPAPAQTHPSADAHPVSRSSLVPAARAGAQVPVPAPSAPAERGVARSTMAGTPAAVLIKGSGRARHPAVGIVPRRRGPRSFMAQFFAGMVTVMLLVSVLTLASPLGRGTVFAGAFQGYANSVPWAPTPTPRPPTPKPYVPPPGANPGQQAIINDIVAIFGPYAQGAINVARCESGFDPNARNPYAIGNSHAEGVFQILYPSTWSTTSYAGSSPYSYDANIRAAHQIFARDGNSWREWACQP